MIDHGKIAEGFGITLRAHALVDCGDVPEDFVRLVRVVFQIAEQPMHLLLLDSEGRDTVAGLVVDALQRSLAKLLFRFDTTAPHSGRSRLRIVDHRNLGIKIQPLRIVTVTLLPTEP